jgi:hypothetical protein
VGHIALRDPKQPRFAKMEAIAMRVKLFAPSVLKVMRVLKALFSRVYASMAHMQQQAHQVALIVKQVIIVQSVQHSKQGAWLAHIVGQRHRNVLRALKGITVLHYQ